ncbi:MAG: hypothetical protein IMW84_05470 [Thermoanaerobacter sp.]|nr:hypothetical protein [Thermoanaerobacter sp.]
MRKVVTFEELKPLLPPSSHGQRQSESHSYRACSDRSDKKGTASQRNSQGYIY